MAAPRPVGPDSYGEPAPANDESWTWQILPTGLMYKLYLASDREPRLGTQLVHERNQGGLWDSTIGGRVGILRYGTTNDFWPQGWQLDVEAAAFPRLDAHRNLIESDFRAGIPLTTRQGPWELKVGYVHNCSHIGDLYLLSNPDFQRINYTRDAIVWGRGGVYQPGFAAIRGRRTGPFTPTAAPSRGNSSSAPISSLPRRPALAAHRFSPSTATCAR